MGVDTHKAEVIPVVLEKHLDADSLSVVKVYNFTVVVRTADWQGVEKAVYVQPDSVLPDKPEYRFLKETMNLRKERQELWDKLQSDMESDLARLDYDQKIAALEAKIDANTKYLRIGVKRLRGVISMGMLLPIPNCANCVGENLGDHFCTNKLEVGMDVADFFGIEHYERMPEGEKLSSKGDDVALPPSGVYAPTYDVESVYKYASLFEPGEMVYVTEKIDGQNARFVATVGSNETFIERSEGGAVKHCTNVDMHAGSRKEWKKKEGGSNWWRVQEQNEWIARWCYDNQEQVLYGESFGWVADLKYGAKQGQLWFRAFDILNGTEWVDAEPFRAALHPDLRAPDFGIMPFDFEKLQKLADGPSLIKGANHIREGIVIKPLKERRHYKLGRVFVKMVGLKYLENATR